MKVRPIFYLRGTACVGKSAVAEQLKLRGKDQLIVLDTLAFEAPKTKAMVDVLAKLNITGKKVLFVLPENNDVVLKSARNLERTNVVTVGELNTYAIMNSNALVLLKDSVKVIEETLA